MKRAIVAISIICFAFLINSCDTNEPPVEKAELLLKLEDVSCTEAWMTLTTANFQLPTSVTIKQNNQTLSTINLVKADTLLYIDSLMPNQTYQYQVSSIENPASSNELSVTTMDTTSHNFTFETFTFGGTAGSSTLHDCAIISPENIWCVGEIFVADTSQNGYTLYNAVHWDGSEWELRRITVDFRGNPITPPLEGVFAFSETEIWMSSGVPIKGNGVNWTQYHLFDMGILNQDDGSLKKIWGINSNDIYYVGNKGTIVHYNGTSWQRIESGTNTNINDVWGYGNGTIYCAVSFVYQPGDQKILTIKNNNVDSLGWNTGRRVHSVWTNSKNYVYAVGGGIFENKKGYWNEITQVPLYYSRNIRGEGTNNIFVCGDFGLFAHFNGSTWKTYNELNMQGIYFAVAVKSNIVITVGLEGDKAIIVRGKRN